MRIGIVGSNDRAVAIGRLLRSGGHVVSISDPCSGDGAEQAAAALRVQAEPAYNQAMRADMLWLAVPREQVDRALGAIGSGADAVIVDLVEGERGTASRSGAEILAQKLDTHKVVRALVNLPQSGSNVPIYGDDPLAKRLVVRALRYCGCVADDRGPLSNAIELEAAA